ncbi:hypothetical protein ACH35V_11645 [Actinomadura sp. 1N219]|uniref:hypothetical protein n=1 Tax=Actinomadura sp. 1N219 TaxID=3375152 RepID=UPI0037BBE70E
MPSQEHDVPAELFRWSPMLAAELLTEMGIRLPEIRRARDVSESFTDFSTKEYTADAAIVLETVHGRTGVVVEVQRKKADDKRWTWPLYLATLRNRQRCPTVLLVIAPDPKVAEWCATEIDTGHPGHTLTPLVLSRDHVPLLKDAEEIAADPAMGVLSALFHGDGEHQNDVVQAGFDTTNLMADRGDERFKRYYNHLIAVLPEAARKALDMKMNTESLYSYSEFLSEAAAKGKAEGVAGAVLRVLKKRGVAVTDEQRERIVGCTDVEQLDAWLDRAITAHKAADVLD